MFSYILNGLGNVGSSRFHGNILVSVEVDARGFLVAALKQLVLHPLVPGKGNLSKEERVDMTL